MAPLKFGIYAWINEVTGRVLVGQTGSTVGFDARRKRYLSELKAERWRNRHFQRSWNKHGSENFKFIILQETDNDELLTELEQKYIDLYRNRPGGVYNQAGPADNPRKGSVNSPEHRKKISIALKGQKRGPLSAEHRKKISAAGKGLKRSPLSRKAISEGRKGMIFSKEHRLALSDVRKKLVADPEFRKQMSDARTKRPVVAIDTKTGEAIHYESISAAGKAGFVKGHIIKCLNGERKSHGGKTWKDEVGYESAE